MALDHLRDTIKNLEAFDFHQELVNIIEDNKDKLADFQAMQLYSGKNSTGQDINPPYSPYTVAEKKKKGQVTDRVTFKDTGELYQSLYGQVQNDQYDILSQNYKYAKMIQRSGQRTVGLNEDSRNEFARDITFPAIQKVFLEKTGLRIVD